MLTLKIARAEGADDLPLPEYATDGAAAFDLHANVKRFVRLNPGDRALIKTGIHVEVPSGHSMDIQSRSGLALKQGIIVLNSPGLVDSDFRGEIGVILFHNGAEPFLINRGDRIAQAVIRPYVRVGFEEVPVSGLSSTDRGSGGFGSTGVAAGSGGTK